MPNAKGDLVSGGKPITETRPFILLVRSRPRLSCPSTAPWTPSPYPDRYCSREPPCRWRWWPTSVSGDRSSKGGGMVVERGAFVQAIFGVGGSLRNPGAVATGSDSAPTTMPLSARGKWRPPSGVVRRRSETCGALVIRSRVPSSGHRGDRTVSDRHGPATSAAGRRPRFPGDPTRTGVKRPEIIVPDGAGTGKHPWSPPPWLRSSRPKAAETDGKSRFSLGLALVSRIGEYTLPLHEELETTMTRERERRK